MDIYKELYELKETIGNEIAQANQEIKKAGGDLNTGDIEMIDKLTHSMKSLVSTCAMLEAEENGYSERGQSYGYDGGSYRRGYSRENRENRENRTGGGYSGNYGSYARGEGRGYSRENRNGYSRAMDWMEHLQMMMDEAPDEATRMDIKKMMDRSRN